MRGNPNGSIEIIYQMAVRSKRLVLCGTSSNETAQEHGTNDRTSFRHSSASTRDSMTGFFRWSKCQAVWIIIWETTSLKLMAKISMGEVAWNAWASGVRTRDHSHSTQPSLTISEPWGQCFTYYEQGPDLRYLRWSIWKGGSFEFGKISV